MKNAYEYQNPTELDRLCASVRAFVIDGAFESCMEPICRAMENFPHAPQPHNLMGIVLEKTGDHAAAMKHFRAAWALDPAYKPANHNLYTYGTFYAGGKCAFDESDLPSKTKSTMEIVYDERGVGRAVSRWALERDGQAAGDKVRR